MSRLPRRRRRAGERLRAAIERVAPTIDRNLPANRHKDMGPIVKSIAERIAEEIGSWPNVTVAPHRFGGREFRVGRRELGHLHGSRLADLPFPVRIREQLVREGKAEPHHILPESGWVSRHIHGEEDIEAVVQLFRMNYDRSWASTNISRNRSRSARS